MPSIERHPDTGKRPWWHLGGLFGPLDLDRAVREEDVKTLRKARQRDDAQLRKRAIGALARVTTEDAESALQEALLDEDEGNRQLAAWALAAREWIPPSPTLEVLFCIAKQDWEALLRIPTDTLLSFDPESVTWVHGKNYPSEDTLAHLLVVFKAWEDDRVPHLVEVLSDQSMNEKGRTLAVMACGLIGAEEAAEPLAAVLGDTSADPGLHAASFLALSCLGPAALESALALLRESSLPREIRAPASRLLAAMGEAAVPGLLKAIEYGDEATRVFGANAVLGTANEQAIAQLKPLRRDPDYQVRIELSLLMDRVHEATVQTYLWRLKDEGLIMERTGGNGPVERMIAALALGNLADPRAIEPLLTAAREDRNGNVRTHAAFALGRMISEPEARDGLIQLLRSGGEARQTAAMVLLQSGVSIQDEL